MYEHFSSQIIFNIQNQNPQCTQIFNNFTHVIIFSNNVHYSIPENINECP